MLVSRELVLMRQFDATWVIWDTYGDKFQMMYYATRLQKMTKAGKALDNVIDSMNHHWCVTVVLNGSVRESC